MNIQSKMPTTADQFLRWNEGREGKREFVDKRHDYRGIDSLRYHLIVSHEDARVWLISRAADNWSKPEEIAGMDGIVTLAELGKNISLGDLYEDVDLRPAS